MREQVLKLDAANSKVAGLSNRWPNVPEDIEVIIVLEGAKPVEVNAVV